MGKVKAIVIFVLMVAAFAAGIYFKDDFLKFLSSFNKQVSVLQKTDFGAVISQAGKEILTPPPLVVKGAENELTLLQSQIILQTNVQRRQNGNLPALKENAKLDEAASAKADDMFLNQYFEHTSPSGVDPGKLVQNYGYDYVVAGENLILGNFASEKEVVQDWMNSPGHRANILNNRYTEIGVVVIKGTYKGEIVWIGVQEFGLPSSSCAQPDENLKNKIDLDKAQLDNLSADITDKKNQIDNADQNSADYKQMIDDYNQLVVQYDSLAETTKNIILQYNNEVNAFNNCVAGT
jgi:uncharacterized protein YkwD